MFDTVRNYVLPFIKTVNGDCKNTAFSRFMSDVYEYCLNKMSSAGKLGQFRTPYHIVDIPINICVSRLL